MYNSKKKPQSQVIANNVTAKCFTFLRPFLKQLDRTLDLRLVHTLANTVAAIICYRQRPIVLLLSELGAYLTGAEHAPAGIG